MLLSVLFLLYQPSFQDCFSASPTLFLPKAVKFMWLESKPLTGPATASPSLVPLPFAPGLLLLSFHALLPNLNSMIHTL